MRDPCRDGFVDELAFFEAPHVERGGERAGFALGHQFGHGPARAWDRFEPARAPTAVDKAVGQRGFADDGAAIARHIHNPAPLAQHF